jgi:CRISPR-associated endonuclease/helicase Cas3
LDKKRHWVEVWDGSLIDQIERILTAIEDCPHTLIVCNHVRTAHQVFEICQKRFGNDVMLLHSRFATKDRNKIEQDLLRRLPCVLVATQVVEVSLNLDFYQAFLEPAPIDAEAQRMGRVNRYGARPPARVVVMSEQVNHHKLYDTDKSKKTVELLRVIRNPISEDSLIETSNQVYENGYQDKDLELFEQALHNPNFEQLEEKLIAGVHHDWADEIFDDKNGRIEILPGCYEDDYAMAMKAGNWLEATSMLVSLSYQVIEGMRNKNRENFRSVDVSSEPWVVYKPYDSIRGLRLDAD